MTTDPFTRVLVGYVPTEQGADARALGVDLAAAWGADLLLASVVAAVWIEHIGEQTGLAVVHSGERERAASALKEAAAELASVGGIGHVERRLEASSSPARGLHDTAVSEQADVIVVGSRTTDRSVGCCWARWGSGCSAAHRARSPSRPVVTQPASRAPSV